MQLSAGVGGDLLVGLESGDQWHAIFTECQLHFRHCAGANKKVKESKAWISCYYVTAG